MWSFPSFVLVAWIVQAPACLFASETPTDASFRDDHAHPAAESSSVAPSAVTAGEAGMVVTGRHEFPQLFLPESGMESLGNGFLAAVNRRDHLVVLDARSGSLAGSLDLDRNTTGLAVDRSGHRVLGVVGSYREDGGTGRGHVLDLSDPYHPVRIAVTEACGSGALVLPGRSLGLVYGSRCATLFDLETGARRAELGANAVSAAAAVVDGSSRLFLVHHEVNPPGPARYRAWDVSNPKSPVLLFSGEAERRAEVLADKRGEIVVIAGYQAITVLDAGNGMPLSTIALSSVRRNVALSDAGGVRMLAVSHDEDVDLYDLGNPAHPSSPVSIPIRTVSEGYGQASRPLLPHPERPWLALAATDPGGVDVVDLEDFSTLLSYRLDGTMPRAIAWSSLGDGTPAVVLTAYWGFWDYPPRPDGGVTSTRTIPISTTGTPSPASGYLPVLPESCTGAVPLGGRYVAVVDTGVNALVLLDTAGWTVVQSMGFTERIGIAEGRPQADSSGTALIVFDHRRAEVFDLIEGRLVRRTLIENGDPGAWLGAVDVTPDGTAIALWTEPGLLQLSRPDGREEAIEVPSGYTRLAVSPDSHRGVLSVDMLGVGPETPVMGIDLEASRVLWEHHHGVAFADFVRGGKAIAATTVRGWWWLGPLLLHPESGVPIGPPGDTTWGLFYFAPGPAFGSGSLERLPYWHWTWSAWASSVFDISGDSARLVGVSEQYVGDPIHLPRDDGRSGLEFRQEGTRLISPEGEWSPFGPAPAREIRWMRHGFFSAVERFPYDDPQTIVLLRDPGVNRPPEARAGDDRFVECAGPSDTPVTLDGSASSDPDSTPGTSDDLATFAWTVDGASIGSDPRVETPLSRGIHVASLEVRDVLDAAASDEASIEIRDTLPPEVTLSLHPFLRGDRLWAHEWTIKTRAEDRCDGTVETRAHFPLGVAVLSAPVTWVEGPAETIEVVSTRRGIEVFLIGPDRSRLEAIWSTARKDGGLSPEEGTVRMELRDPPSRGLLAAYTLVASGRVTSAAGFGPEADLPVAASARDSSGWVGVAETSLRREIDRVCRELPANAACR